MEWKSDYFYPKGDNYVPGGQPDKFFPWLSWVKNILVIEKVLDFIYKEQNKLVVSLFKKTPLWTYVSKYFSAPELMKMQ